MPKARTPLFTPTQRCKRMGIFPRLPLTLRMSPEARLTLETTLLQLLAPYLSSPVLGGVMCGPIKGVTLVSKVFK